jgi:hypothetical protein
VLHKITPGAVWTVCVLVVGVGLVVAAAPHLDGARVMFILGVNIAITAPLFWTLHKWQRERRDLVRLFELLVGELSKSRRDDLQRY